MSNVKQVHIVAEVGFDFLDELSDREAARFVRAFGPSSDLRITWYETDCTRPSPHGGQTAIYRCAIIGRTDMPSAMLDRLRGLLASQGKVTMYDVIDIEDFG